MAYVSRSWSARRHSIDIYGVLRFWEKYGLAPTLEAFKVKRRTLYHWRWQLRMGGEDLEALNEKPKAPYKAKAAMAQRDPRRD
jgi:hypothetical protein